MLKRPPLEERDGTARMHLGETSLIVELDAVELAKFRWSLWFLATTCPHGEDITIWANGPPIYKQDSIAIGYCEITLVGEGPVGGKRHNPNNESFLHCGDRVDFAVNRAQAEYAYRCLKVLNGRKIGQQTTLFGNLVVTVIAGEINES